MRQDGCAIQYVKNPTSELFLEAVKQDGLALQFIHAPTPELRLEAVKQNGWALQYIPKQEQTLSIALAALKQNTDSRECLAARFRKPTVYKAVDYDYKPEDLAPSRNGTKRERT